MYTTGQLCKKIGITNHTLQSWMKRHPDLIECVLSRGGHRRFPAKTAAQIGFAALARKNFGWSVSRLLEAGKQFANYSDDVRIGDGVLVLVTNDEMIVGPRDHRKFSTEHGVPRNGSYFDLTDVHREFFGPHKPRDPETSNERRQRLGFDSVPEGSHLRGLV